MESTWRSLQTNQRRRQKVDWKVKHNSGLFDWNESSILSFYKNSKLIGTAVAKNSLSSLSESEPDTGRHFIYPR